MSVTHIVDGVDLGPKHLRDLAAKPTPQLDQANALLMARLAPTVVQKYNPNHEPAGSSEGGQFASADGPSEIMGLQRVGFESRYGMGVGTLAKAMFGTIKPKGGDISFDRTKAVPSTGRVLYGFVGENVRVHGTKVEMIERYFDPETKTVIHEDLILNEKEQGKGTAAKLLDASFKAYDKAGYEKVTLFAGLQLGAYTWAKMGFEYKGELDRDKHLSNMRQAVKKRISEPEFLSPKAKAEYDDVMHVIDSKSMQANQILVDLPTPELDKLAKHWTTEDGEQGLAKGSSFMKYAMYYSSYDAVLNLKGPGRVRADRYIKARKKR